MTDRCLEELVVPAANPARILDDLERAISGAVSLLPVPDNDPQRAQQLRTSQRVGEPIDEDIALVVATSGSTGTPKGAQLTAVNLISSADATHRFLGGEGQWLLAMPGHHIAGIQVLVRSLIAGIEPLCMDVSRGFHIGDFAAAAAELSRTDDRLYTSLTPAQLLKTMDTLAGIEALRLFDAILVGGAPLPRATRAAAEELGITIIATYGSSETSGGCVYDGRPIPGARVRVREGRIELGGPMIAAGYRNLPNHEAFTEPGWFTTSDAGKLIDDSLTVTGRLDAIIDTGGLKLHPEVLERALTDLDGVTSACVVGIPDQRFGQAVVAAYTGPLSPSAVISGLDDMPRWQLPKQLLHVDELPLIGPGKIDRLAVQKLFS